MEYGLDDAVFWKDILPQNREKGFFVDNNSYAWSLIKSDAVIYDGTSIAGIFISLQPATFLFLGKENSDEFQISNLERGSKNIAVELPSCFAEGDISEILHRKSSTRGSKRFPNVSGSFTPEVASIFVNLGDTLIQTEVLEVN